MLSSPLPFLRRFRLAVLAGLLCLVGAVGAWSADAADNVIAVSRIEPIVRALQQRYFAVHGKWIEIPARDSGGDALKDEAAAQMPDGFYNGILKSRYERVVQGIIGHIQNLCESYRESAALDAPKIVWDIPAGAKLETALPRAMDIMRRFRYLHGGSDGVAIPYDQQKSRMLIQESGTFTQRLSSTVEWFNLFLAEFSPGASYRVYTHAIVGKFDPGFPTVELLKDWPAPFQIVDGIRTFQRPEFLAAPYALVMNTSANWSYRNSGGGMGYVPFYVHMNTGFALNIQYPKQLSGRARPLFSITAYSSQGTNIGGEPAGLLSIDQTPLWYPDDTHETVEPPLTPWISTESRQRGDIVTSDTFIGSADYDLSSPFDISVRMDRLPPDFDLYAIRQQERPAEYFYQIDFRGLLLDLEFTAPIPTYQPLTTEGDYAGSCPACNGVLFPGASTIDNGALAYYHDAWDYRSTGGGGGCFSCGGMAGADASPTDFSIGRMHRYRDLDWGASFGPGVLCNYDLRLQVFADERLARFFDPYQRTVCELADADRDGVFHDGAGTSEGLWLRDATGRDTVDLNLAATAELVLHDGRRIGFQLQAMAGAPADGADLDGRLLSLADRDGHMLRLDYADALAGFAFTRIVDGRGRVATVTWGRAAGQPVITDITVPGGGTITYRYGDGRSTSLSRIEYPTGEVSTFRPQWDAEQQLVSLAITDAGADGTHRRKTVLLTPSLEDGPFGGLVPQLPNLVRQVRNGAGELVYRNWVIPDGDVTNIYVLSGGGPDGAGILRRLRYRAGLPIGTDVARFYVPDQDFASLEWIGESEYQTDARMRPGGQVDPAGLRTTYERDADGNITTTTRLRPDGSIVSAESTTWDGRRNPLTVTDALGRVTRNTYDAAGHLTRRVVAAGTPDEATYAYTYDTAGRLSQTVDANGNATDYAYDDATGLLTAINEPADGPGQPRPTRRFTYDPAGRPLTSADAAGRTVTYAYDARGRPTVTTYADGSTEETVYGLGDDANLVTKRKDRNGVWEEFAYDGAGRQLSSVLARGQPGQVVRTWSYLPGKDAIAQETVNGSTTAYVYDERGRVSQVTTWATPTTPLVQASATWDAQNASLSIDDVGRRTFSLTSVDGLRSRTVRERLPAALTLSEEPAEAVAALWALSRPTGSDPAYTIDDALSDAAGQPVSRSDAAGVVSASEFDAQGRTTADTTTDPVTGQEITTRYAYDAQGNRTRVVHPRSFAADSPGTFETITTYTGRNLVAAQTERFTPAPGSTLPASSVTTATTYTITGKPATQSDPRNPAWLTTSIYGACCDRLVQVIDALGYVTATGMDPLGRVTSTTDATGHVTTTQYDAQGRVLARTDGAGATSRTDYDEDLTDGLGIDAAYATQLAGLGFGPGAVGSATRMTAPTGEVQVTVRDGIGRDVRRIDGPAGDLRVTSTAYSRTADGLDVVAVTSPSGETVRRFTDGAGRVVRTEQPGAAGAVAASSASYDAQGNALRQVDANGVTVAATYDGLGRPLTVSDGGGSTVRRSYDVAGNVVSETDALGATVTRRYDGQNRLIAETDRLGHVTRFAYDAAGNRTAITDAEGGVTATELDARGAVSAETYPGPVSPGSASSGGSRRNTYDAAGRPLTQTDQRGVVTTFAYDAAGRVVRRTAGAGPADTFTYDDAGRLLTAVAGRSGVTITRTYADGRLQRETQQRPDGTSSVSYRYDAQGRPTALTLDDGTELATTWSSQGRSASGSLDGVQVFTRRYDAGGRLTQTTLANGLVETRSYTGANQVASIAVGPVVTPPAPLLAVAYGYDANHRKTSETDPGPAGERQTFAYDAGGRLTDWTRTPGVDPRVTADRQLWELSPVGDWTATTTNGARQTRRHDAAHQTVAVGAQALAYDANGNLTRDHQGRRATWDADNRLRAAELDDPAGGTQVAEMVYDALGRRVALRRGGRTTVFVLNGTQVIQERDVKRTPSATEQASDGELSAADAEAPPGSLLDQPGGTHLNFQPATAVVSVGWLADKGRSLGERTNGLHYGWTQSGSPQALAPPHSVERDVVPRIELDTLHALTASDATAQWRLTGLANGTYAVVVIAGDPASLARTNHLRLNNERLTDPDPAGQPSSSDLLGDYDGWAVTATVTDGVLTLSAAADAVDPALDLIEIGPVGSVADDALRQRVADAVREATARTAACHQRPPSPRTFVTAADDYIDAPIALRTGQGAAAKTYSVHSNALYSPQALTDATGHVVERYTYTAFGQRTVQGSDSELASAVGLTTGFTGLRDDGGLLFARARYFSPELGRWISRDPAGYVDGWSLYNGYFVPNGVDPEGKYKTTVYLEYEKFARIRSMPVSTLYRPTLSVGYSGLFGIAAIGFFAINILEYEYNVLIELQNQQKMIQEYNRILQEDLNLVQQLKDGIDIGEAEVQRLWRKGLLTREELEEYYFPCSEKADRRSEWHHIATDKGILWGPIFKKIFADAGLNVSTEPENIMYLIGHRGGHSAPVKAGVEQGVQVPDIERSSEPR